MIIYLSPQFLIDTHFIAVASNPSGIKLSQRTKSLLSVIVLGQHDVVNLTQSTVKGQGDANFDAVRIRYLRRLDRSNFLKEDWIMPARQRLSRRSWAKM